MTKTPVIQLENVSKIYGRGRAAIPWAIIKGLET